MRYKSLKVAIIAGIVVKIGQELELSEKVAKSYIEAGFIEEVIEDTAAEQKEPEVKQEDAAAEQKEPEVKQEEKKKGK